MIQRAKDLPTTADEFLRWPESDGYEFVEGQPVERKEMGARSAMVAGRLHYYLTGWCLENGGHPIPDNAGYQCFSDDPQRVRKPDVSFIRAGRLPGNRVPEGWITIVPDLVVEVISPNDTWGELSTKVTEYLAAGVRVVWVIDPTLRQVIIHRGTGDNGADRPLKSEILSAGDILKDEELLPGFKCQVRKIFEV